MIHSNSKHRKSMGSRVKRVIEKSIVMAMLLLLLPGCLTENAIAAKKYYYVPVTVPVDAVQMPVRCAVGAVVIGGFLVMCGPMK